MTLQIQLRYTRQGGGGGGGGGECAFVVSNFVKVKFSALVATMALWLSILSHPCSSEFCLQVKRYLTLTIFVVVDLQYTGKNGSEYPLDVIWNRGYTCAGAGALNCRLYSRTIQLLDCHRSVNISPALEGNCLQRNICILLWYCNYWGIVVIQWLPRDVKIQ